MKKITLLVVGFTGSFFAGLGLNSPNHATAAYGKRCDYSHIRESGGPEIGENGAVKYNENWKKMVDGGWLLKTASSGFYIFERCQ